MVATFCGFVLTRTSRAKGVARHQLDYPISHDTLYLVDFNTMKHSQSPLLHINGYDVYYETGAFIFDPMPDLLTLQALVGYLTSEGFIEIDEAF